jgi:hypothetical protein
VCGQPGWRGRISSLTPELAMLAYQPSKYSAGQRYWLGHRASMPGAVLFLTHLNLAGNKQVPGATGGR